MSTHETPQPRRIEKVARALRAGQVIAYPTDSSYGLACAMGDRSAMERIRQIRGLDRDHFFTLVCRDLSEISQYAKVENAEFSPAQGGHARRLHLRPEGF